MQCLSLQGNGARVMLYNSGMVGNRQSLYPPKRVPFIRDNKSANTVPSPAVPLALKLYRLLKLCVSL
jgi:hypothetical protein